MRDLLFTHEKELSCKFVISVGLANLNGPLFTFPPCMSIGMWAAGTKKNRNVPAHLRVNFNLDVIPLVKPFLIHQLLQPGVISCTQARVVVGVFTSVIYYYGQFLSLIIPLDRGNWDVKKICNNNRRRWMCWAWNST